MKFLDYINEEKTIRMIKDRWVNFKYCLQDERIFKYTTKDDYRYVIVTADDETMKKILQAAEKWNFTKNIVK